MNMRTGIICIITALLFSGCSTGSGEEIDLSPMPIETEEARLTLDSLRRSDMTPFIMPQYGTESYEYYSSLLSWGDECIPGNLYLLCKVSRTEEAILLLSDTVFKEETGMYNFLPWDRKQIYAVTAEESGDTLMKVDQETGQETVLYHADGERINYMIAEEYKPYDFYFSSGSRVMQLNIYTDEVTVFAECENEVSDLTFTLDSVAWADGGNYFLYDYEKGEGAAIAYEELHPFCEVYAYHFRKRDEVNDLYMETLETGEEELILENITRLRYTDVTSGQTTYFNVFAQVGQEYIISVNMRYGDIETVYYAVSDDMELIHASTKIAKTSGDEYVHRIYVREGDEVVSIDPETLEAETLFKLENGLMEDSYGGHEFYGSRFVEYSLEFLGGNEGEYDLDKFYICGECDGDYCLWADMDYNWFWYHPHSGENEAVEVTMVSGDACIVVRD